MSGKKRAKWSGASPNQRLPCHSNKLFSSGAAEMSTRCADSATSLASRRRRRVVRSGVDVSGAKGMVKAVRSIKRTAGEEAELCLLAEAVRSAKRTASKRSSGSLRWEATETHPEIEAESARVLGT